MKTYLVTGAAGFIGGAVARRLLESGNAIITIDNLSTGFKSAIPEGVIFIKGNCQNPRIIEKLKDYRFDAIFHIAGQSSGEISFEDPVYDLQTNAQSTLLLLKYALNSGCKKFIYASTMSVYGEQPDVPVKETAQIVAKSFYGVGKIASENYMRIYNQYGINCTALRLFNVYGPGQNMKNMKQGMVSIYLSHAIINKHIQVKGSADRFRDFVYIDDVTDAFIKVLDNAQNGYHVYNIGTGVKTKISELVEKIRNYLPFEVTVEYVSSTPGDQFGVVSDIKLIRQGTGWEAKIELDLGIRKMVAWAIKQRPKKTNQTDKN